MKGRNIFLLMIMAWLSLAVSCGNRGPKVIPENKMVDLLVDMELTEAYVNSQMTASGEQRLLMGRRVLQKHGVTEEELDTTLAWYGRNMDDYSKLYEKVDKELERRRIKYTEVPGGELKEPDNLWPYGTHLILSPLSGDKVFTFSIQNPDIEKGQLLDFTFYLPNPASFKGTLGVEYTDGLGEAMATNFAAKRNAKLLLQTDTAKTVARLFGIMDWKEVKDLPLYLDSISLKAEPLDTTSYKSKKRSQKTFGLMPVKIKDPEMKDSIENNLESKTDSIQKPTEAKEEKEVPVFLKSDEKEKTKTPPSKKLPVKRP